MNAIRHEEREKFVLTNEAIEVHLSYLRTGFEAVQTELPKLREKIEAVDEKLSADIKSGDDRLASRIDALGEKLSRKIDQANTDRAAGDAALGEKIDRLIEVVLKMQGSQDGLKWFIASVAIIASGVSIARSLGWM
jgi:Skp family chaperone for outer membrane proteins